MSRKKPENATFKEYSLKVTPEMRSKQTITDNTMPQTKKKTTQSASSSPTKMIRVRDSVHQNTTIRQQIGQNMKPVGQDGPCIAYLITRKSLESICILV